MTEYINTVNSLFVTQLSMLAIEISDILRRELYVLPYDGEWHTHTLHYDLAEMYWLAAM